MTLDSSTAPGLQPEVDEPLLTTSQLARVLQVHPDTITRSWVPRGCPYELRTLRGYRFRMSAVKAWLANERATPDASAETIAEMSAKVTTAFARLDLRRRQGRAP
ncbi:MAG: helix-turn-helix domain-containing protein [Planctomycetota bacterium]|nr:helix-turn-helix domain-containing protein [Planctomycetota bacterium]